MEDAMIEVLRKGYNYLASPYSSPAPAVRHLRYTQAVRAAAFLMRQGHVVFSPIAHSHNIEMIGFPEPQGGNFWQCQDEPLLVTASRLLILMLPGWPESKGIEWELRLAKSLGLPILYLHPADMGL
jgi:hypothetical protein